MNKLDGRVLPVLLLLTLLAASVLPEVDGQRRRRQRRRRAPAMTAMADQPQPKFQLDCTLSALTTEPLPIDNVCADKGSSASGSNSAKQNTIKNRFCLPGSPTTPIEIDFATIDALQQAAQQSHIPFGRKKLPNGTTTENLPPNRSLLVNLFTAGQGQQLGEGTLVTLEAFIFKAQHSNTFVMGGGGESVNCNSKSLADNDIHIALSRTKTGALTAGESSECETVTAEITPHHRSEVYNRFDTNPSDFLNGQPQKPGQDKLRGHPLPLKGARVRVTGQLFFDGSHSPCVNGHGGPPRRSIWEIHPVFSIDVFDTVQNKFVPFEEWAQSHTQ
jgi:hypothetical protein